MWFRTSVHCFGSCLVAIAWTWPDLLNDHLLIDIEHCKPEFGAHQTKDKANEKLWDVLLSLCPRKPRTSLWGKV